MIAKGGLASCSERLKYHWLSYGPLFRDIHLMLDEQATLVYDTIDEFAERGLTS